MPWLGSKTVPSFSTVFWAGFGVTVLLALLRTKGPRRAAVAPLDTTLLLACLAVVFASLLLLEGNPTVFSALSRETRPVEDCSFLAWSAAVFFLVATLFQRRREGVRSLWLPSLYAAAFFICAMEEVSWLQHLLGFSTPAFFEGNAQHETNLHNFALPFFERVFFFATGVFFVVAPVVRDFFPVDRLFSHYERWLPGRAEFHWALLFVPSHFRAWRYDIVKSVFFATVAANVAYACWSKSVRERAFYGTSAMVLVLVQSYLQLRGYRQVRIHDIMEYQEMWVAVCAAAFSCRLYLRNRTAS